MKLIKLFVVNEKNIGTGKEGEPYRKYTEIYNMDGELLYGFDGSDKNVDDRIKKIFL